MAFALGPREPRLEPLQPTKFFAEPMCFPITAALNKTRIR
jgi:hypothetical protein